MRVQDRAPFDQTRATLASCRQAKSTQEARNHISLHTLTTMIESDPCFTIIEEGHEDEHELPVTFSPPLYLQRRMIILDALRQYSITEVRTLQHAYPEA